MAPISDEIDDSRPDLADKSSWWWPILRWFAFSVDAEHMHELVIYLLRMQSFFLSQNREPNLNDQGLSKQFMGLTFRNPIGLAAGFDVDAECLPALAKLGFGFIEVGGITQSAQPGNKKPRIFRLPEDQAIINRLNFYNKGAERLRNRLLALRQDNKIKIPIGINLGKSNSSSLEDLPNEYAGTFKIICEVADYVTINVSCPNTPGLQRYQTAQSLGLLLDRVCVVNESLAKKVPLLLKLGPDLSNEEAIACAEIALDYRLAGLVISNTTQKRNGLSTTADFGEGGLSGQPLFERSTQLLRCVAKDYGGRLCLVGSGGIMNGSSALAKLHAGADLLQIYTGLIYGGPGFVKELIDYIQRFQ